MNYYVFFILFFPYGTLLIVETKEIISCILGEFASYSPDLRCDFIRIIDECEVT